MLNRRICRRCICKSQKEGFKERNRLLPVVLYVPLSFVVCFSNTVTFYLDWFHSRVVFCPTKFSSGWDVQFVKKDVPNYCPYELEHTVLQDSEPNQDKRQC
jgi:hypothetical protein